MNAESNSENLMQPDQRWKVELITRDFDRPMFNRKGV